MSEYLDRKVVCRTLDGEKKEVRVGDLSFRPSIYGVAIQNGKVLLVPCWDGYDFPGGGIHEGEPLLEALVREVKEESGIEVQVEQILHALDDFFIHPKNQKAFHSVLLYYSVTPVGGELSSAGLTEFERSLAKERQPEWVDIDKALICKFYNPVDSPALIRKAAGL
jgi:8-oxo-dGTP pyrophosphatase MutT (NUDIX family)